VIFNDAFAKFNNDDGFVLIGKFKAAIANLLGNRTAAGAANAVT